MTPATQTRLRSATAVAIALVSIAATFPASAATITRQHYQKRVDLTCGSGCIAALPKLAANQALDIDQVACDLNTAGDVLLVALDLVPQSLNFSMLLGLIWKRSFGGTNYFTLGGEVNVRVPLGRQARVVMLVGGTPYGNCSVTGTLLTYT